MENWLKGKQGAPLDSPVCAPAPWGWTEAETSCGVQPPGRECPTHVAVGLTALVWLWNGRAGGGEQGTKCWVFLYPQCLHADARVKWRWEMKAK